MDIFRRFRVKPGNSGAVFHLAQAMRETRHAFPVATVGYIPKKTTRITQPFNSLNFSFILNGGGTYLHAGRMLRVEAPCVITQSPGVPMDYGPDGTWEELYLIYDRRVLGALVRRGLFSPEKPLWRVLNFSALQEPLDMLCRELLAPGPPAADRIDLTCEMLILASVTRAAPVQLSREERVVRELEARMRADFLSDYDIGRTAAAAGVHPATLRRYWDRAFGFPPARYAMRLRMNEACRMLVETKLTVSEISYALKFEDPLYFSRKFKGTFGCTATEYRNRHRYPA